MKEIKAYIKRHKLDPVVTALRKVGNLTGMSVLHSSGFGQGWRIGEGGADCRPGVKIEIVCKDEVVDAVVKTIAAAAHTGLKGDGIIFVSEIGQALRISTGEGGEDAV